jgi:hypothetical protein
MPDFWPSCGYRLLQAGSDGRLRVTDAFLQRQLLRPELAPVDASCTAELALHDALLHDPRRRVDEAAIDTIADADARDNYRVWLRFRDRLLAADSLESAYAKLFAGDVDVPPLFVHELTQILPRHVLGERANPLEARAAEMLFRPQKITVNEDGAVMAADLELVERHATSGGFGSLGELLRQNSAPVRSIELDVLDAGNAEAYWARDERHDLAVGLGQPALDALSRVLEKWIAHFLAVEVTIRHRREIDDRQWVWHVGLDAEASGILNDLYNGVDVDEDRMGRLLCLFELRFANAADMRAQIAGRPVWLAMAIDAERRLKPKAQNLLLNLPLARAS